MAASGHIRRGCEPMGFAKATPTALALLAAVFLGACANNGSIGNAGAGAPTASIAGQRGQPARGGDDDTEASRPVPPDPYKTVQYRGGRDPVSGVAPGLDGELPPPPKPPARSAKAGGTGARVVQPIAATSGDGRTVEVKPGDTLFSIASRNKVSIAALKQANNLTADKIVPGQRLVLP